MIFNEIKPADKPLFDQYLAGQTHRLITYCFASFYLWRNWDCLNWAEVQSSLVVKSDLPGEEMFCVPCSADDNAVLAATESIIKWCADQQRPFCLCEATAADVAFFEKHWPGRLLACEYLPGANYIYSRRDLAELPGSRFHAKRNHIQRFLRRYPNHRLLPLGPELLAGCREQLLLWGSRHNCARYELAEEERAILDALDHWQELACQGAALLVGDRVAAFTIGGPLSADTYCIQIEKADTAILGAYQAINCWFVREFTCGYTYINRAEDMGKPGLAKAKRSYHPCRLEKNYCLTLRQPG